MWFSRFDDCWQHSQYTTNTKHQTADNFQLYFYLYYEQDGDLEVWFNSATHA